MNNAAMRTQERPQIMLLSSQIVLVYSSTDFSRMLSFRKAASNYWKLKTEIILGSLKTKNKRPWFTWLFWSLGGLPWTRIWKPTGKKIVVENI